MKRIEGGVEMPSGVPWSALEASRDASDAVAPSLSASDVEREPFGPLVSAKQRSSDATIVPRLFHVEHFTRTPVSGEPGALLLPHSESTNPGGTRQAGSRDSVFRDDFDRVYYAEDSASRWRTKSRC